MTAQRGFHQPHFDQPANMALDTSSDGAVLAYPSDATLIALLLEGSVRESYAHGSRCSDVGFRRQNDGSRLETCRRSTTRHCS